MRSTVQLARCLPLIAGALCACAPHGTAPPTAGATPATQRPIASVQELMQAEVDTSADGVWNAVETVVTKSGTEEHQPRTAEEWAAARNAAIVLVEAGNLLAIDGRRVGAKEFPAEANGALDSVHIQRLLDANRPAFNAFAAALQAAGIRAIAAIDAKNPEALVKAGGEIDEVCEACHLTFWYPDQVIPALPGDHDPNRPYRREGRTGN
jgi:hypothetical protein